MKKIVEHKDEVIAEAIIPPKSPNADASAAETIMFFIMVAVMCLTLIVTTRMYTDTALISDVISHYTLRGKDILIKDNQLVFVN